jgi:hypothetical protein
MTNTLYEQAMSATLSVCSLDGKDALQGKNKTTAAVRARCILVRLLVMRGCSDAEISQYTAHSYSAVSKMRVRAEKLYKDNLYFANDYDYANHLMHECIQLPQN